MLWLGIGTTALIALGLFNIINVAAMDKETVDVNALVAAVAPALVVVLIALALWYWLNSHIDRIYSGEDSLLGRETRLAWNLLIATLTIFVLVAARPLEQTFIRSLTDKRFAGSAVPQFVGLENYANLLTIRVDTVPCRKSITDGEMFQTASYLPRNPTLQNYEYVFCGGSFLRALRNSALVSTAASLFALVAGSFAAYALGRLRFRGRSQRLGPHGKTVSAPRLALVM